ncbi:MAG: glycosyltransferase family 2 protein [Lachnospiraceae bacterium]|nr:glycosyltransferase family 2 protein [Lachnospiraceae bacterium]
MNRTRIPTLYLVIPCYNEEEVIEKTAAAVKDKINRLADEGKIERDSKALFVNDGSSDNTLRMLHELSKRDPFYGVLSFAGNYGHQSAILAGMMEARHYADAVVTIDADLQQDIEALDDFLAAYMSGCDVVYGVRNDRKTDGFLKKATATMYYKLMHMLGSSALTNSADYRLMSSKALDALSEYEESSLFLRGLIPTMGFSSDIIYFDVKEREAGQSKYTFKKMMTLALDGITSCSIRPLRMIGSLGFITVIAALVMVIISIVDWANGKNVQGYTTLLIVMLVLGGVILISLGVMGEYIGKTYMEAKHRPRYIVDTVVLRECRRREEK